MSMSMSEQRELAELHRRVTELERLVSGRGDVEIASTPKHIVGMANPAEPWQDSRGRWRMQGKAGAFRSREAALAR